MPELNRENRVSQ